MDGPRFDDLSRTLAARGGRRALLRGAAGALVALAGARRAGAQERCSPPCADGLFCCGGPTGTCLPHEQCCGDFVPCPGGACCGAACLPAGTPCCGGRSACPAPGECCGELCVAAGQCCGDLPCPGGGCATPCPDGQECCGAPETGTCVPVGQCCAAFLPCPDGTCCNVSCLPAGSQCCAGHVTCPAPGVCCGPQGDFCCVPPNVCVDGACVLAEPTPAATPIEPPPAQPTVPAAPPPASQLPNTGSGEGGRGPERGWLGPLALAGAGAAALAARLRGSRAARDRVDPARADSLGDRPR